MKYRIIVAGSRDFDNYDVLEHALKRIISELGENTEDMEIISGTCRGVDRLGEKFADEYGILLSKFPADWGKLGRKAGPVRNAKMAQYASQEGYTGVCVALWDGESRGTGSMIRIAKQYGLLIYIVDI